MGYNILETNASLDEKVETKKEKVIEKRVLLILILVYMVILLWNIHQDYINDKLAPKNRRQSRLFKHISIIREQIIRACMFAFIEFSLIKSVQNVILLTLISSIVFLINEELPIYSDKNDDNKENSSNGKSNGLDDDDAEMIYI